MGKTNFTISSLSKNVPKFINSKLGVNLIEKDGLGITLDPKLKWNGHIDKCVAEAVKNYNLMRMISGSNRRTDHKTLKSRKKNLEAGPTFLYHSNRRSDDCPVYY